ncbi:MAG: gamma-glutamyl-gamma-aminobutyrate hydrolase family protein [Deltaproteobacteria bacterium]|nr:gamma-glutamyl-gamma-aminobutyrate hydrolase family protein [Deltaproteobacteria bacterium]
MKKRKIKKQSRNEAPLIGITPDTAASRPGVSGNRAEPLLVLQERYTRAVQEAGGVPLILPIGASGAALRRIADSVDGILVSGGNFDIHPRLYGEEPTGALGQVKEERTRFELELISLALERDLPLLGVCGGAQAINVVLGGSLYQDIARQIAAAAEHQQGALKDTGGHKITIHAGTKLKRIVGREELEVNTTHHQAVKRLGRGLIVNATAGDGVIEGIESKEHPFVLGVQWHPEFLTGRDARQRNIFTSFVRACRESGK